MRLSLRFVVVAFASAALAVIGCSLFVEFDESRIPTTDAGATDAVGETSLPADTGAPPPDVDIDSGAPGDTMAGETTTDTGTAPETAPADTGTPIMETSTDTAPLPDVPVPVDTDLPDTASSD